MTPTEISKEYKERYDKLIADLGGRRPTFMESFPITEWHRLEWCKITHVETEERKKEEKLRELAEANAVEYVPGKPVITGYIICRTCGIEFPKPTTRGRPPVKCVPCRTK